MKLAELRQKIKSAQTVLDDINENPIHPANDARHPLSAQTISFVHRLEGELDKLIAEHDKMLKQSGFFAD